MTSGPDVPALLAFDRAHLWHPYAALPAGVPPLVVTGAEGTRLRVTDAAGDRFELVDGMSSWWATIHGYAHPALVGAVQRQAEQLSHVMFGGLTHEPAAELGRRLVELAPAGLDCVFFADSGSVAVEVALKMAVQHWQSRGEPARHRLLTWRGGYHGDTLFAMSVCDPEGGMHALWTEVVPTQHFVGIPPAGFDAPVESAYVDELRTAIAAHAHELAAVVVEPVVQGAGGMRFHNPAYLRVLREACDEHDVLLIFDEIATGFGRTGPMFAAEWADVSPDILCVGKALTGGMLTLAATLCTRRVADGISNGSAPALMHGPTFMANPLACAAAAASIDLLRSTGSRAAVERIEAELTAGLAEVRDLTSVTDVRVLGAIGVIQLDRPVDVAVATAAAVAEGVWLRPFRDLIYAMPPYVSTSDDVAAICRGMAAAARAVR